MRRAVRRCGRRIRCGNERAALVAAPPTDGRRVGKRRSAIRRVRRELLVDVGDAAVLVLDGVVVLVEGRHVPEDERVDAGRVDVTVDQGVLVEALFTDGAVEALLLRVDLAALAARVVDEEGFLFGHRRGPFRSVSHAICTDI